MCADKVMKPGESKNTKGINHTGSKNKIAGPTRTQLQPFNRNRK